MPTVSHVLQLRRVDSAPVQTAHRSSCSKTFADQPFDSVSTGSSEDADLVPVQSGEDWIARLDDDLSQPAAISGDSFRISTLQREDPVYITLHLWIVAGEFPPWAEVKSMLPELRSLWTTMAPCGAREVDRAHSYSFWSLRLVANSCSCLTMLPYLVAIWAGPEPWLGCHIASIGRACRTTLKNGWVSVWRVSRGSHRWDRIAMDILDVCDPTPRGIPIHLGDRRLLQQVEGGLPHEE